MPGDQYEPNRVLGIPWTRDPNARQGEEPQRVMGFPVDWFGRVDTDWLQSLAHPVRGYRRWPQAPAPGSVRGGRRRPGPPVTMDDDLAMRLTKDLGS